MHSFINARICAERMPQNAKYEEAHLKHLVHIYHGKATVARQKRTHSTFYTVALD